MARGADSGIGPTIGLTGGIGSGKSTVARIFAGLGAGVVDADVVAREVVEPPGAALAAIRERHGPEILTGEGRLDRARLRERVFADSAERGWLEGLLHPLIAERIAKRIAAAESPYGLLVSPLLLETGQRQLADRILVVDVSRQTQLERALARDQGKRETIEAIIDAQMGREARLAAADDIIDNEGGEESLPGQVEALHRRYLAMAANWPAPS